jgi:hypothetical protein
MSYETSAAKTGEIITTIFIIIIDNDKLLNWNVNSCGK